MRQGNHSPSRAPPSANHTQVIADMWERYLDLLDNSEENVNADAYVLYLCCAASDGNLLETPSSNTVRPGTS